MKSKYLNTALACILLCITSIANAGIIKTFTFDTSDWDYNSSGRVSDGDSLTIMFDDSTDFNNVFWSDIEYFQFNVAAGTTYKIDSDFTSLGTAAGLFSETDGLVSILFSGSGPNNYIYGYNSVNRLFGEISTSSIWPYYHKLGTTDSYHANLGLNQGSNVTIKASEVPEPSTLAIFALGMIGLVSRRFKKQ